MGAQEVREEEPVFESGTVMFSTGDLQVLELNLTSKRIDVDVKDKAFLKRIIQLRGEISPPKPTPPTIKEEMKAEQKSGSALSMLKSVAEALSSRGITLIVSYRGKRVATVGAEAKPTLLQLITKTRAVSLNSLLGALRMIL